MRNLATQCEMPNAYLYTLGSEPPVGFLVSSCSGSIERVALSRWARMEQREQFRLCTVHRGYFEREGRVSVQGGSRVLRPSYVAVEVEPAG